MLSGCLDGHMVVPSKVLGEVLRFDMQTRVVVGGEANLEILGDNGLYLWLSPSRRPSCGNLWLT